MMLDAMRTQEDPLQRQRLLVEEERPKYLNQEELLIQQLQWVQLWDENGNKPYRDRKKLDYNESNLENEKQTSNPTNQPLIIIKVTVAESKTRIIFMAKTPSLSQDS